jgi:hypothetical protein
VGEAADVDVRAQQLDDRLDVDLGRLEQDVRERRPRRSSSRAMSASAERASV